MNQPSLGQIHRAAIHSSRNAKRYQKDAKVLIAARSYGHAIGLLALAEEEAGKALIFRFYADGYLHHPQWLRIATGKHEAKHATMAVTVMVRLLYFLFFGLAPNERPEAQRKRWLRQGIVPGTIQVLYHHLKEAAQDVPRTINTAADIVEELTELGRLQRRREHGFFVDIDDESGEPTGPHEFSRADAAMQFQRAKIRLAVAQGFVGSAKFSLRQRQAHIEIDTETRSKISSFETFLFGKKGLKLILDWIAGHESREWVEKIREFAADEESMKKVEEFLREFLTNGPLARPEAPPPMR